MGAQWADIEYGGLLRRAYSSARTVHPRTRTPPHDAWPMPPSGGKTARRSDPNIGVTIQSGHTLRADEIASRYCRLMSRVSLIRWATDHVQKKSVAFFSLIALVHFALTVALLVSGLHCGMQASCASSLSDIAGEVLAFPLNLVPHGLGGLGIDVDEVVRRYLGGEIVVLYLLNSLLAAVIIWFGVVNPLHRRKLQRHHRSA